MNKIFKLRKGQLLVETIIGIGLVTLVLSAIVPLFLVGVKGGSEPWKAEDAQFLANETIESLNVLKEENWNNIYRPLNTTNKGASNPYHLAKSGNSWILASGSEDVTLDGLTFNRYLIIENVSRTGQNGAGDLESVYTAARDDPSTQKITVKASWPGSNGITLISYLTRYKNSIFSQTDWSGGAGQANWQDPPNKYFSSDQIDDTTAGELKLATVGGSANEGNQFVTESVTNIGRLSSPSYRDAIRFTAQKSATVNQIRVYIGEYRSASGITYRYGIQDELEGQPSGTYLQSATATSASTGWQSIAIPNLNLTAGTTYYIVVQWASGTIPTGSRYINLRSTLPANYIVPKDGITDLNQATLYYTSSWAVLTQTPIFLLQYTDSTYEGNPYDNFANRSIYGAMFEGEALTYTADTGVSGVGLYAASLSATAPQANLNVTVTDVTGVTTLVPSQTCLLPADVTTTFAWKECVFAGGEVTFPANHIIRVFFSSPTTTSARAYLIKNVSNPATAEYISANWKSTNAVTTRSTNSGGTFSDSTFIDMSYYLKVGSGVSFSPWGELVSSSIDTGNVGGAGFNRISWIPLGVLPAGTTIKLQLAANNDNTSWSNWYGPTGLGTWYTISGGENIWTGLYSELALQPARYFRYKIRLETTNGSVTPTLDSLQVNYSP